MMDCAKSSEIAIMVQVSLSIGQIMKPAQSPNNKTLLPTWWGLFLLIGLGSLSLGGCGSAPKQKVFLEKVLVDPDKEMNGGSPLTMDVVICYNDDLLKKIADMDASTYYKQKPQLLKDNKDAMDTFPADILAGNKREIPIVLTKTTGTGGFIFALYNESNVPNRAAIGEDKVVNIELGPKEFKLYPS